jgi:hypothetical protein
MALSFAKPSQKGYDRVERLCSVPAVTRVAGAEFRRRILCKGVLVLERKSYLLNSDSEISREFNHIRTK